MAHSISRRCAATAEPLPPAPAAFPPHFPASLLREYFFFNCTSSPLQSPHTWAQWISRSTALTPSPQTQALAFEAVPFSTSHSWGRQNMSRGRGRRAPSARAGCRSRASAGGCSGGSVGLWLIAPVNHGAAPRSAVYFSDSNLVLALFHTCHRVFFLTLEACRKRTVINGAIHPGGASFITL